MGLVSRTSSHYPALSSPLRPEALPLYATMEGMPMGPDGVYGTLTSRTGSGRSHAPSQSWVSGSSWHSAGS